MPADFVSWVRDPARTQEELITVERMTEMALDLWRARHGLAVVDFQAANAASQERIHQRGHNPAYLPVLLDSTLERTAEVLEEITSFQLISTYQGQDRTPRTLSPLRWLPRLVDLKIGASELVDPEVLGEFTGLRVLHLSDQLLDDLRPLSACRELRELQLHLARPWPDLTALAALEQLEIFNFYGNVLALEDVLALPQVRVASITGSGLAPRDLRRLPAMPLVEVLKVSPVFGLAGIERYPRVRSLRLGGPMEDLRPLAALRAVTFAELQGDAFRDVSPLATLPEVRWLLFQTQRPRDYSPLAAAPRLHEVEVQGCDIHELELGALHAGLEPWDAEWALAEPRPLPPELRFFYAAGNNHSPWWPLPDPEGATWNGDSEMEFAERRWFQRQVQKVAAEFFGEPELRASRSHFREHHGREAQLDLKKWEHLERLPALLEALRVLLARTRFRHAIWVGTSISVQEARGLEQERPRFPVFDEEWEKEREKREQKEREQLEREHRFALRKSEGDEIDPEEFAAPPLDEDKVLVPAGIESNEPQKSYGPRREIDPEDETFDPDAWRFDEEVDDWDFAVYFTGTLTEEAYIVQDFQAAAARHYLQRKPEKLKRDPR